DRRPARRAAGRGRGLRSPATPARFGTCSRLEQEVDRVAEQIVDLVAELGVGGELGVAIEDLLRDAPRLHHDRLVAWYSPELEVTEARLALPHPLTGPSDLEVLLREREAVGALGHRREPKLPVL